MTNKVAARINGKDYALVLLRVREYDKEGRPSVVDIGYDDSVFNLADESKTNEFITCFIPHDFSKPKGTRQ